MPNNLTNAEKQFMHQTAELSTVAGPQHLSDILAAALANRRQSSALRGTASRLHIDIVELKAKLHAYSLNGEDDQMSLTPLERLEQIGS